MFFRSFFFSLLVIKKLSVQNFVDLAQHNYFTIAEYQSISIDVSEPHTIRQSLDRFEALKS